MSSSPYVALAEIRRNFGYRVSSHAPGTTSPASTAAFLRLGEHCPHLGHPSSPSGQHAVLHAVQVAAVDGWYEAAGDQAEDNAGCEVVFAESVAKLEVLVEHGTQREGYGLEQR